MSRNGFYYMGTGIQICCYKCNLIIHDLDNEMDLEDIHQRGAPECEVARLATANTVKSTYKGMDIEQNRVDTFPPTRICHITPIQFARSGFFYTGTEDSMMCFSCNIVLRGWVRGDTADGEHTRHNPFCPFLTKTSVTKTKERIQPAPSGNQAMNYAHHDTRLASFYDWTSTSVSSVDLASAGFYYSGVGDEVHCFHCKVGIEEWLPGEDVFYEHVRYSPQCNYAKTSMAKNKETHECKCSDDNEPYRNDKMAAYLNRLKTFNNWPSNDIVTRESLAAAGFYYKGKKDTVTCHWCGIHVRGWVEGDKAVEQHLRLSPTCKFIIYVAANGDAPSHETQKQAQKRVGTGQRSAPVTQAYEPPEQAQEPRASTDHSSVPSAPYYITEEQTQRREGKACKVCKTNIINTLFNPCGCRIVCDVCAVLIPVCHKCRRPVAECIVDL